MKLEFNFFNRKIANTNIDGQNNNINNHIALIQVMMMMNIKTSVRQKKNITLKLNLESIYPDARVIFEF